MIFFPYVVEMGFLFAYIQKMICLVSNHNMGCLNMQYYDDRMYILWPTIPLSIIFI